MPPPVSPLDITPLPFTRTITVAEAAAGTFGGVANQVWCRVICAAPTYFGFYATSPGFNIETNFYENDGTTNIDSFSTGSSGWIQLDVDTYYIRFRRPAGAIPNDFVVNFAAAPTLSTIPPGAILINDDTLTPSTYPFPNTPLPATVWDLATGTFLGFADQVYSGEIGDSLPDGTVLYQNRFAGGGLQQFVLVDSSLNFVTDFDLFPASSINAVCFCNDGTNFYVYNDTNNGIYKVTALGSVVGPIATIPSPADNVSAIGITRDSLFLYWAESEADGVIHVLNLTTDTEIAPLYTIPGFSAGTDSLARTGINDFPGEILVQSDNTIVTYWHDFVTQVDHLIHISPAGALLHDIAYDQTVDGFIDHIHYSPSQPDRVYLWLYSAGSVFGSVESGRFADVVLADGSQPQGFDTTLGSAGINNGTDSGVMFFPSVSCFMVTMLYGEPTPPGTGNLSIAKQVIPGSDFTTIFNFLAGGGLSPGTFFLSNMDVQSYIGLTPGDGYSIEELVPPGWTVTYNVSNGSPIDNILITDGQTTFILVTNTLVTPTPPEEGFGGIYKIVPGKRQDTIWLDVGTDETYDVKIPNPKWRTGLVGE